MIQTTMAEPCDKCGKLDANECAECSAIPLTNWGKPQLDPLQELVPGTSTGARALRESIEWLDRLCEPNMYPQRLGAVRNWVKQTLEDQAQSRQKDAGKEMSLVVALDFADNPRPYHTLQAPADTNGELYRALAVLAKAYRTPARTNVGSDGLSDQDRKDMEADLAAYAERAARTWTDDDDESLRRVLEALERIENGVTVYAHDNLLKSPLPRKMTITDAKEIAKAHIPTLRRLKQKLDNLSAGN